MRFSCSPGLHLSIRIIGDYNKINEVCCGAQTIFAGPATRAIAGLGFAAGIDGTLYFSGDAEGSVLAIRPT